MLCHPTDCALLQINHPSPFQARPSQSSQKAKKFQRWRYIARDSQVLSVTQNLRSVLLSIPEMPGNVPIARRKRDIFFHADFNLGQLLRLAERLRSRPCTCDDSQSPKAGALNWAIFLEFDDGVEWVFRAPCSSYAAAKGITRRLLASEAATLKYIREHTTIPVPEVFHYRYLP